MGNFLNTLLGSYVKQLIALFLSFTIIHGGIVGFDWTAFALSLFPVIVKALKEQGGFFNTWYGGLVKSLIVVVAYYFIDRGGFSNLDLNNFINAVWTAIVPVLINTFNVQDPRYGIKIDLEK